MIQRTTVMIMLVVVSLAGCATLSGNDAPNVRVVGMEPLPSEGLEVRFELKLRVQNPNETALGYDGMSVNLDLDGRGLASGVSNAAGEIPRFGEVVLTVPVSISAFSAIRQLLAQSKDSVGAGSLFNRPIVYTLKGKLGAPKGSLRSIRFSDKGDLDLFSSETESETKNQ